MLAFVARTDACQAKGSPWYPFQKSSAPRHVGSSSALACLMPTPGLKVCAGEDRMVGKLVIVISSGVDPVMLEEGAHGGRACPVDRAPGGRGGPTL